MRDGGLDFALTGLVLYGVWTVGAVVYLLTAGEGMPVTTSWGEKTMTNGLTERQRRKIIVRDGGKCVRCGIELWGDLHAHHRMLGGMGGGANRLGINDGANLVALCERCHAWVHGNVTMATRQGYLCPSWEHPSAWPVLWRLTRWRQPSNVGWVAAKPAEGQDVA